eukprot:jgi/Chrzof1/4730/Cz14g24060.t1
MYFAVWSCASAGPCPRVCKLLYGSGIDGQSRICGSSVCTCNVRPITWQGFQPCTIRHMQAVANGICYLMTDHMSIGMTHMLQPTLLPYSAPSRTVDKEM